ncbi:MAG: autoinducer binding domain-containing protein [Hyphomicrobium sp.]
MHPRSVDEYLAEISACTSSEQLFSIYRDDVEREGFQNVVFIRQSYKTIVEVPYLSVPEGALETYFEQNLAEHDPMVRLVGNRAAAFTWNEMERQCVSKAERDTLGICREIGCTGGYAMPFYGPNGHCDVFDITFREKRSVDPARTSILSVKTYAMWLRFLELDSVAITQNIMLPGEATLRPAQARRTPLHHSDGHERVSADECRALVICDIAARRYKGSLTQLNDGLQQTLGNEMLQRLISRGLLADVPDDDNMRYFYQPSPVAVAHLKRCPHVAGVRDQAWRLHVKANERPEDMW